MGGRLEGLSILLVDDDPDGRDLLDYALSEAGATVITAASAAEALERFKSCRPSIVVTDVAMPALDGVWLCEQIRALADPPRVPVVALTALVFPRDRDRIQAAGFDAHLPKPYGLDDLHKVIELLTARRR
jgi:CheY-like chemotaxis protein